MNQDDHISNFTAILTLLFVVAIFTVIFFSAVFILPIVVVVGGSVWAVRAYRNTPAQREKRARASAMALYDSVRSATAALSPLEFGKQVHRRLPPFPPALLDPLLLAIVRLYDGEELETAVPEPPPICDSIEGSRYRDRMNSLAIKVRDPAIANLARDTIVAALSCISEQLPPLPQDGEEWGSAPLLSLLRNPGEAVQYAIAQFYSDEVEQNRLFVSLRDRADRNLCAVSGLPYTRENTMSPKNVMPVDYKGHDLAEAYLAGTPLYDVFMAEVPYLVPMALRLEHHHILASSGHGKTQTLQALIARDLEAVAEYRRSIVVIDSQGDMIKTIARLKMFAPGEELHGRLVLIDPTDVEWPVSLNLFDVGQGRLAGYSPLERERLTNSILELYDFVLGSLLGAEMTQKQNVIFRYVTRLMLHIPDATIHTLRELMEKGSEVRFAEHIAKLEGTARHFFETEFASREFAETRTQVLRRLWGILENQTFERMFSHPRSKLDLFSEMNAGKVILINTAKDLLKGDGTEIFGRFFIAMIAQAAQERAVLPEGQRMETIVYIDEAADYFDRNIGIILSQARKYKVGMVLAHQYLSQLEPKLQDAFAANTAIKFAGGFNGREARSVAAMMGCDPASVENLPKGTFAATLRGITRNAVPLRFPFGVLEDMETQTKAEQNALREYMRARYAVHYSELMRPGDPAYRGGFVSPTGGDASSGSRTSRQQDHDGGEPDRGQRQERTRGGDGKSSAHRDADGKVWKDIDIDPDNPDTKPSSSW